MVYRRWQGPERPVSNGSVVTRLRLPADADAPAAARAALVVLRDEIDADVFERALLLTSEVVTNAVMYSGGAEVRLDIWRSGESLAVMASDDGPGFEPVAPAAPVAGSQRGIGLTLIDALCEAWGSGSGEDSWVWFEVSARVMLPRSAQPEKTLGEELLDIRMAVDSIKSCAVVALDTSGNVTNWGAGAVALMGFAAEVVLGRHLSDLYVPASPSAFAREKEVAESHGSQRTDRWIRRLDGSQFWAEVTLSPIRDRSQRERGLSVMISDITARKREADAREQLIVDLRDQASTDELTGLANRRRWIQELRRELARSRRQAAPLAVAMLDLNRFKAYNDTYGHLAGDDLLRSVANEWAAALRASDMLGRYGGDEFSISLPGCPSETALDVVRRVQAATPAQVASAAGVAYAVDGDRVEDVLERADAALYAAKRNGDAIWSEGSSRSAT